MVLLNSFAIERFDKSIIILSKQKMLALKSLYPEEILTVSLDIELTKPPMLEIFNIIRLYYIASYISPT